MAPNIPQALEYDGRYFEAVFACEDPWNYGSDYEQVKYQQTLSLLGGRRFASALEIGCAEGRFTAQLLPYVDRLLAVDISATALARTQALVRSGDHVRFSQLDVFCQEIQGRFDLIVCSELLAYLPQRRTLELVLARVLAALEPEGLLVMANAKAVADERDKRGFDWSRPFGARTIADVAIALGASLHEELSASLYAVHSFSWTERPAGPRRRSVDMGSIPDAVAVAARGLPQRAAQAPGTSIPVLAYHRIAESGPAGLAPYRISQDAFAEQMAFLHDNGYAVLSLAQFRDAHVQGLNLPHRSVLLTFDDGYRDFAERALPMLEKHGFPAALFVVEDRVGRVADWDSAFGEPEALLDWADLRDVARRNVTIGSHTRTHPHLSELPAESAVAELSLSRTRMEAELGRPVTALAYPYGDSNPLVATWAASCGYELAFTCREERSAFVDDRMLLPRITVYAQDDLASFASKLIGICSSGGPAGEERRTAPRQVSAPARQRAQGDDAPAISVVIPTRNRCPLVEELLHSLAANALAKDRFEILVVSDGSSDETNRRLEERWGERVTLLPQEHAGAAEARNHGIGRARGDLILLLDDDLVVERDCLEAHVRFHREWPEDHHACLGFMAWPAGPAQEPLARYLAESDEYLDWKWVRQRPPDDVGWRGFWTGHLSLKRRFLKEHGLFDGQRFRGLLGEDLDLGKRLDRSGLKLHFRDSITAWHQKGPTFSEFAWRHFRRSQSRACLDVPGSVGISPSDAAGLASAESLEQIIRAVETSAPSAEPHLRAALYREALRFADAAGRSDLDRPPADAVAALLQSLASLRAYTTRELAAKSEQLADSASAYAALHQRLRQTQESLVHAQAALEEAGRRARNRERELAELTRRIRGAQAKPSGLLDAARKSLRLSWTRRS
ncbi:MAG TPA: polysaccharide deacetylase family protein [Thermoanaerobaculia bacterium]|jgi:peptidoglycan/xylan/chitin deacetylase (PgdA/CDA1 family)/glycosyltransferase involved in cell wall biosynthesis/SAM-dependent methyltransferase|nr:polysaccharide deacetylase family protein [Thermoanaerobaculia bacterium]